MRSSVSRTSRTPPVIHCFSSSFVMCWARARSCSNSLRPSVIACSRSIVLFPLVHVIQGLLQQPCPLSHARPQEEFVLILTPAAQALVLLPTVGFPPAALLLVVLITVGFPPAALL